MKDKFLLNTETKFNHRGKNAPHRIFNILPAALVLAGLYFGLVFAARAQESCEKIRPAPTIVKKRVTYLGPFDSTSSTDLRTNAPDRKLELKGLLYYASGTIKNAPVIIYNHGHDEDRSEPTSLAEYFVSRGFVVFAPLRRGHFYESNFRSTGVHTDVYVKKCMRSESTAKNGDLSYLFCGSVFCRQNVPCSSADRENALEVEYMRMQKDDVSDQINYIKNQPAVNASGKLADPKRIAILGHSYGGSLIIFANENEYGQNVAIDVCGAEKSWGTRNPFWESDLTEAMNGQTRPMYFLQPKNGLSLEPTSILFSKAIRKEYRSQAAVFPAAPWDSKCTDRRNSCWDSEKKDVKPEWEQAHSTFIGNDEQLGTWGCSVIEFINRYPLP